MTTRKSSGSARPLRVAFLTPSLHVGGAERWILSLARNFVSVAPAGVVLCAPHFHPAMLLEAARLMPVYVARKFGDPAETRRLVARACADADALITWGVPHLAAVTRGLAGQIGNPPCNAAELLSVLGADRTIPKSRDFGYGRVAVIDVSHSDGRWEQQTKLVRRAAAGADFHVAVSRAALAAFPDDVRRRAVVIYNGAEVDRAAPRRPASVQKAEWGAAGQRTALFLGRFEHVKGFDRLLAAAPHLPSDWMIVAHGHGSLRSRTRESSGAGSLTTSATGRVHIRPPVAHVGDALAAADCVVMPSRFEGMPLALVEAFLAGVPVVATPFAFVEEAEAMHGCALVERVPPNPTGKQLAAAIVRAGCPSPANRLRTLRARRIAWQHYTAAAMAQRWEEFLYAACGG